RPEVRAGVLVVGRRADARARAGPLHRHRARRGVTSGPDAGRGRRGGPACGLRRHGERTGGEGTLSPAGRAVVLAGCLTVAYTQLPLYSANQNTYFLHGLANSGSGQLAHDWLAKTADPVPVFSALVQFTVRWLWPPLFHLYTCALYGA